MASPSIHVTRVRSLYKAILRLNRGLPTELNELGNMYTRDEFKRHKKCTPEEAHVFMVEWSVSSITSLLNKYVSQMIDMNRNSNSFYLN
jgi:Complex1_LYR-like